MRKRPFNWRAKRSNKDFEKRRARVFRKAKHRKNHRRFPGAPRGQWFGLTRGYVAGRHGRDRDYVPGQYKTNSRFFG